MIFYFFFFQAEDGIRDYKVTGVQTCALPISQTRELANVLRGPWGAIAPVLPTCSGGLTPQTLAANYETLGRDILPMAGSAIFGHPLGAAAGVAALRQAAERYFQDLASPSWS